MAEYSAVVFGGWFCAGGIKGLQWFEKKLPELTGKTVIVFATGATPAEAAEAKSAIAHNALTLEGKALPMFYLHSGLAYEKMGVGSRLLMTLFCTIVKKKQGEDNEMYKAISHSYDASRKEALAPLVALLRAQRKA